MQTLLTSCLLLSLSSGDYTMAAPSSQSIRYTLWQNESTKKERSRLLPGCPFDGGSGFFADDPDSMHDVMGLAVQALEKPKPTYEDFIALILLNLEELYELDNDVMKDVANAADEKGVGTNLDNRVHNILNKKKRDYSVFRQLAINAALTDPT
jgi:hypothetical protein